MKIIEVILMGLGVLVIFAGLAALAALFVMLLWNWLCPVLFGLPEIGLFQAWGLAFLCSMLFKGNISVRRGD